MNERRDSTPDMLLMMAKQHKLNWDHILVRFVVISRKCIGAAWAVTSNTLGGSVLSVGRPANMKSATFEQFIWCLLVVTLTRTRSTNNGFGFEGTASDLCLCVCTDYSSYEDINLLTVTPGFLITRFTNDYDEELLC